MQFKGLSLDLDFLDFSIYPLFQAMNLFMRFLVLKIWLKHYQCYKKKKKKKEASSLSQTQNRVVASTNIIFKYNLGPLAAALFFQHPLQPTSSVTTLLATKA